MKTASRIFITGASGFIGTHFVNLCRENGVACFNYDKVPPLLSDQNEVWFQGDILDCETLSHAMAEFRPDFVLHLAARTDLDGVTASDYRENTDGTRNVLQASADVGTVKRVVVASTMYVCKRGYVAQSDGDYCVDTVYGQSKVDTEEITRNGDWPFEWAIVRPAVIWGPYHMRMKREFFRVLEMGLYFHPGKSQTMRSYGYVENTAWQMMQVLFSPSVSVASGTFYLADPPIDLYDWVNECSHQLRGKSVMRIPTASLKFVAAVGDALKKAGINFPLTSFRLSNITSDWTVDTSKIESVAGAVPYDMKTGVERTVSWLRGAA